MHDQPVVTVIIPVFDEARTLDELMRRVVAVNVSKQIIVVDDASTDGSAGIAAKWGQHSLVTVLKHPVNRGKGAAIRTALPHAVGRFTIVQDADLEYDPEDYGRLLRPLIRGEGQVIYGSRFVVPTSNRRSRYLLDNGVRLLNWAVWLVYGVRLTDEATCYKALDTEVLRRMNLECERFDFCSEVTAKACRMGLVILEVPIDYHPRNRINGKKLRWTDGLPALRALWRWRKWRPRNADVRESTPLKSQPHQAVAQFSDPAEDSGVAPAGLGRDPIADSDVLRDSRVPGLPC